jgi:hypothetical protein
MHLGRVKIGDHYSVSPEATLGPTVRELVSEQGLREKRVSREITRRVRGGAAIDERLASDKLESKRIASQRIQEFESRQFEGSRVDGLRVREFESSSSTVV